MYIYTYIPAANLTTTGALLSEYGALAAECMGGWLRLVGSFKLQISFAKEPYKRDDILQKRPIIVRSLPIVATP